MDTDLPEMSGNMENAIPSIGVERHEVKFTGDGDTYFRIWLVNTALSILTLGIYSAWAKVRRQKYITQNLWIAGSNFDFNADPISILKGRLIIGVLAVMFWFGDTLWIYLPLVALALFVPVYPWLVVRSLIFNMTQTSYRGVRFGFTKDYQSSYLAHTKALLISVFSLGIATPISILTLAKFKLNNIWIGRQKFHFGADSGLFFSRMLKAYAKAFVAAVVFFAFIFLFVLAAAQIGDSKLFMTISTFVVSLFGYVIMGSLSYALFRHVTFTTYIQGTRIGQIWMETGIQSQDLVALYIRNGFMSLVTLGLYLPYAQVNIMKELCKQTTLITPPGELETFTQAPAVPTETLAEAASDIWDIDIGI